MVGESLVIAALLFVVQATFAETKPPVAVSPSGFSSMPMAVRDQLYNMGCLIPQDFEAVKAKKFVNIIRGRFITKIRTDYAVLCSVEQRSRILVLHSKTGDVLSEVAIAPDSEYLQSLTEGAAVFSRRITRVPPATLLRSVRREMALGIDPWRDGVNDAFIGKSSTVRVFSAEGWRELAGAD